MVKCLFADRLGRKVMREIERPLPPYYTLISLALPELFSVDWYEDTGLVNELKNRTILYQLREDLNSHARYEEL